MAAVVNLERTFADIETKIMNPLGYIPIVSSFTGFLRAIAGKVQAIVFGILAVLCLCTGSTALAERHLCTMFNGFANMFRGYVEMIFIVGNFLCFVYDMRVDARIHSFQYVVESVGRTALT